LAAFVVLVASAVVFGRVLVLIGATASGFLKSAAGPLLILFATLAALAGWLWFRKPAGTPSMPEQENPAELKPALLFAMLYAIVLIGVAAARDFFGQRGLYVVAALSGLTDMDAITLSVTQLVNTQGVTPETGWRCIVIAALSNLVFKAATIAVIGHRGLFSKISPSFAIACAVGIVLLATWK
jgi:uncharacterized membrane protein (DUF4010 family)